MLSIMFTTILVICSISDIKSREIPVVMPVILSLTALAFSIGNNMLMHNIKASLVVFVILYLISLISKQALGYGDVAVLSACALHSGIIDVILIISISLLLSTIITLIVMLIKKSSGKGYDKKISIPLIPYITAGFVFTLI